MYCPGFLGTKDLHVDILVWALYRVNSYGPFAYNDWVTKYGRLTEGLCERGKLVIGAIPLDFLVEFIACGRGGDT